MGTKEKLRERFLKMPSDFTFDEMQHFLKAYCQDEGIEPDKSYTGVLNVRLTPAIHRQIAMLALQAGLSINAYIKEALEEKVESAVAM